MNKIIDLLGNRAEYYLGHTCKTIDKSLIHVPSADTIDKVWINSDRNIRTLNSLQTLLGHGRLANTGYVSILPVDQGINILPELHSLRILFISILRISSNWPLKADATELPPLSEFWAR